MSKIVDEFLVKYPAKLDIHREKVKNVEEDDDHHDIVGKHEV